MSDLIERMRSEQHRLTRYGYRVSGIIGEAADLIEQLQAERDALAAHIERLKQVRKRWGAMAVNDGKTLIDFAGVMAQSPQASLAERDAKVSRDAIRAFSLNICDCVSGCQVDDFINQYNALKASNGKDGE